MHWNLIRRRLKNLGYPLDFYRHTTRTPSLSDAIVHFQEDHGLPVSGQICGSTLDALFGPNAQQRFVRRIVLSWSYTTNYRVTQATHQQYHYTVSSDGTVFKGVFKPEDNSFGLHPRTYAKHAPGINPGSIGIVLLGFRDFNPLYFEDHPHSITEIQVENTLKLCANLCRTYKLPLTPRTVLTKSEIPGTYVKLRKRIESIKHKVRENNVYYDFTWIPGLPYKIHDPHEVGDLLRARLKSLMLKSKNFKLKFDDKLYQGPFHK